MRSISYSIFIRFIPLLCVLAPALSQATVYKALTPKGCFSSSDPMTDQGSWTFQSPGYCQKLCVDQGFPVMGTTKGSNCWCGKLLPAANSKVADSKCSSTCDGFPADYCGGPNTWSVQLTGVDNSVDSVPDSDSSAGPSSDSDSATSSSSSAATPIPDISKNAPPSVVTRASTVVVTAPGQTKAIVPSSTNTGDSKRPNKTGIAIGVVIGILAVCAVIGGLFYYLRNRKRRALEDNHQHHSAISAATRGQPTSSSSMSDSRLEPSVMMQRRQSDGSIADNQDYSRRILKVTNPDGT